MARAHSGCPGASLPPLTKRASRCASVAAKGANSTSAASDSLSNAWNAFEFGGNHKVPFVILRPLVLELGKVLQHSCESWSPCTSCGAFGMQGTTCSSNEQ